MNRTRVYWLTCVLTIVAAVSLQATTIVMPSDEQLIAKSPVIVEGTVLSTMPADRNGRIWTETVVEVSRVLKGHAGRTIVVREVGGEIGNRITKIYGAPDYRAGEHVLLFLTPTPRGDYQTIDLYVGKFTEERMMNGRRLWMRHDELQEVTLLDADLNPIEGGNIQRDGEGFERFVTDRVAGRRGMRSYGVANPVLENELADRGGRGRFAQPHFSLLAEPAVYRWFAFETGGSARWYSSGTQPGYTGGGVTEVQSAMAAWNNYAQAKISYSYAGTTTSIRGLDTPNGVNEILFNDPLSEIPGSWNPATGGVVGRGGFNGVSGQQSWTSTFAADASHPQATYQAYNITEGNLTIQDNVQPSTGLNSTRLAEIIAHEFGHTLGFGHSADSSALMYATVTGLGASLRSDDQVAARWLYPNGGGSTPPPAPAVPAAPTSLTANVSGSNVALQWTDNANNETGYSVYLAAGSGSFIKLSTDLPANSTGATVSGLAAGTYRFYVAAFNATGYSSGSNTVTATVASAVIAGFSVSPLSGIAGQTTFTFTDTSTGNISSRSWQFGDGTYSSATNPTHLFTAAGQYVVTLTVYGDGGQSSASRTIGVSAPLIPLTAAFSYSPSNVVKGQSVAFTDQSTGGVTSWLWNFGDGTSSGDPNPIKTFGAAGSYNVTLTVFRNSESSAISKTVVVSDPVPASPQVGADFEIAPSTVMAGQSVRFTDRSSGSPTSWSWNFGDGTTSTQQNPNHVFAAAGTYSVTLVAANAGSTSSLTRIVTVSPNTARRRASRK